MATFRDQYKCVMGNRQRLLSIGAVSEPEQHGAVAILSPFLPEKVYDPRDSAVFCDLQNAALVGYFEEQKRETKLYPRATVKDFAAVLGETAISSVVVTGMGNFSAISVPLDERDGRYTSLTWRHLAGMAKHVKMGQFIMLHCLRYPTEEGFYPPLPLGVVYSHAAILGNKGEPNFAADMADTVTLPEPITSSTVLSYGEIKTFRNATVRHRHIPHVPDSMIPNVVYDGLRDARNAVSSLSGQANRVDDSQFDPLFVPTPLPDLSSQKQYFIAA